MARRATEIAQERKKGGFTLLLDAGDSLVGDQDPARKTQGQTSVAAMNMLGYDAMALGPQDIALGPEVLRERIAEAQFAVLSANAIVSATGKLAAEPYVLRQLAGHTIAIVGLSGGDSTSEIIIHDPLDAARSVVAQAARQAQIVIVLSHAGESVDRQIAETVPGIAVMISGGPFTFSTPWQSARTGTLIIHADEAQPGHAGRILGLATLDLDPQGLLVKQDWQQVTLTPEIADDPAMAAWVAQQTSR